MKQLFIYLLLGLSTWACNSSRNSVDSPASLNFDIVEAGTYSGVHEEQTRLVKNEAEWDALWQATHAHMSDVPVKPEVDFSDFIVLGIFMGDQASGGHKVEINTLSATSESVLQVEAKYVLPGKNCITTLAITAPYCIVKVAKNPGERVLLNKKEHREDC